MSSFTPSPGQAALLRQIDAWYADPRAPQTFYAAGWAGTGKSTTVSYWLAQRDLRAAVAAYTGKAAHVLRRRGLDASTIHSLIYRPVPDSNPVEFVLADTSELEYADILVLDEVSMVPDDVAWDLLSFGRKTLVLGDPAQLPPVRGAGYFTRAEPDALLTEVHRQALESPVLRLATYVREYGRLPPGDPQVVPSSNFDAADYPDHQLLVGVHRRRWAETARARARAGVDPRKHPYPRAGEPVLCCRNDRALGLYNGMLGVCTEHAEPWRDTVVLRARMEGQDADVPVVAESWLFEEHARRASLAAEHPHRRHVQLFDWAYALTCHKAQGSEWPAVAVVDDSSHFREHAAAWLYTSVTRASDRLVVASPP